MIETLFTWLTTALSEQFGIALLAAVGWGIVSILLSPCHLASVPLVVGFMGGIENLRASRGAVIASVFAAGIFITIAVVGAVTALLGGLVGDVGSAGNYVVAIVLFVIGLHLLGVIPMPWSGGGRLMPKRKGLVGAFVLGLLFGVAVGPCTFAYFMPVLGFAFLSGQTNALYGTVLVAVTAIGHCSVIVAAGTAAGALQR